MVEGVPKEERTEQWKTDGECLKCRRHGYCKKQCRKNEQAMYAEMRRILANRMAAQSKETEADEQNDEQRSEAEEYAQY